MWYLHACSRTFLKRHVAIQFFQLLVVFLIKTLPFTCIGILPMVRQKAVMACTLRTILTFAKNILCANGCLWLVEENVSCQNALSKKEREMMAHLIIFMIKITSTDYWGTVSVVIYIYIYIYIYDNNFFQIYIHLFLSLFCYFLSDWFSVLKFTIKTVTENPTFPNPRPGWKFFIPVLALRPSLAASLF